MFTKKHSLYNLINFIESRGYQAQIISRNRVLVHKHTHTIYSKRQLCKFCNYLYYYKLP